MARFSDRMVPETVQVFWAAMAAVRELRRCVEQLASKAYTSCHGCGWRHPPTGATTAVRDLRRTRRHRLPPRTAWTAEDDCRGRSY